jgi:hypothetical protein
MKAASTRPSSTSYSTADFSRSAAAAAKDCCPIALGRAIKRLKDAGVWDDHVTDIQSRAPVMVQIADEGGSKRELEMPTPNALSKKVKAGASRLGDGRPYGGKGNTWGEYRECWKIGTAAVADAGVSVANAMCMCGGVRHSENDEHGRGDMSRHS